MWVSRQPAPPSEVLAYSFEMFSPPRKPSSPSTTSDLRWLRRLKNKNRSHSSALKRMGRKMVTRTP